MHSIAPSIVGLTLAVNQYASSYEPRSFGSPSCWKVLGGCCRLSVQQLDPIEEHIRESTTSQPTSPLIARTSQDTVHWITCRALTRLRRGSDQQPSRVTQCSSSR